MLIDIILIISCILECIVGVVVTAIAYIYFRSEEAKEKARKKPDCTSYHVQPPWVTDQIEDKYIDTYREIGEAKVGIEERVKDGREIPFNEWMLQHPEILRRLMSGKGELLFSSSVLKEQEDEFKNYARALCNVIGIKEKTINGERFVVIVIK